MYICSITSTTDNFFKFIGTLLLFVLIVICAYFVTRWIGNFGQGHYGNKNIKVIEGCRVGPNKMIQIVKVGNKFFVLGIGKDEISYIGEVEEQDLTIAQDMVKPLPDFKEILAKAKEKIPTKNK